VVILLMAIGGYSINDYRWLWYQWLLVAILLMAISGYFINGYWLLSYISLQTWCVCIYLSVFYFSFHLLHTFWGRLEQLEPRSVFVTTATSLKNTFLKIAMISLSHLSLPILHWILLYLSVFRPGLETHSFSF